MKTVALIHGWAEGPWQSSQFASELQKQGLELADSPKQADIIFAHSAGCYLVPKRLKARLVILVGLPYWPGKPQALSVLEKLALEAAHHKRRQDLGWFLNKVAHNIWYIFTKPVDFIRYYKNRALMNLPTAALNRQVILIRNASDRFCHPEIMKLLQQIKAYEYVELPGLHDDCWITPDPYIRIIKDSSNVVA